MTRPFHPFHGLSPPLHPTQMIDIPVIGKGEVKRVKA